MVDAVDAADMWGGERLRCWRRGGNWALIILCVGYCGDYGKGDVFVGELLCGYFFGKGGGGVFCAAINAGCSGYKGVV